VLKEMIELARDNGCQEKIGKIEKLIEE